MSKPAGGNPESSPPSMEQALEILTSLEGPKVGMTQQPPTGNPPQPLDNVVVQPPAEGSSSQRRDGKRLMNAREKGKGPLGFPPVQLLPSEITPMPRPDDFSHRQMPGTIQPPPQIEAFRSVQPEPTDLPGQDLAYPPVAPTAGENNWKNRGSSAGENNWKNQGSSPDKS